MAAEAWDHQSTSQFYYLSDGHYRWGDFSIDKTSDGYKVGKSGPDATTVPDLATAAKQAGADEAQLNQWIATAQRLKIYAIKKVVPQGYVEMELWGSEKSPYGLRYAPEDNDDANGALLAEVSTSKDGHSDLFVLRMKGRFFYFE